jgi:PmbA protein
MSLAELAVELLDWMRRQDAGIQAELYLARGEERGVEMREGRLDDIHHGSCEGAGLRILAGGRMGFGSAGGLSPEAIQRLYRRVREQMVHLQPDPCKDFPTPLPACGDAALEQSLWDEGLFQEPLEKFVERLRAAESEALAFDRRLSVMLRSGYGESRGEAVIANTRGILAGGRSTSVSIGFSALAREGGEVQVGSSFQGACKAAELDFSRTTRQAAQRTVGLLGGRKLAGGRRAVIFDPWVAGDVLGLVARLLCADEVHKGRSLLAGALGRRVGSNLATFQDDPRRIGGLGSSLNDDEGCPTCAKTMIAEGVLKDYFYDTYTARKDSRAGNASSGRDSYKGPPGPGASNFYLAPGTLSREKLIADTRDGLLVFEIMGMHMADPVSGEFSVGVSGFAVEGGEIGPPVKKAMISGNLLDLLAHIDAVANDLTFYGAAGSPTFRVADMNVA